MYSPTLPATTSFSQSIVLVPPPVKIICFTTTFSCAEVVRITCRLEAFGWLKE